MIPVPAYLHDDLLLPNAYRSSGPLLDHGLPDLSTVLCDGDSRHQRRLPRAGSLRWRIERVDLDEPDHRFENAEVPESKRAQQSAKT